MKAITETALISSDIIDRATAIVEAGLSGDRLDQNDLLAIMAGICASLIEEHLGEEDPDEVLAILSLAIWEALGHATEGSKQPGILTPSDSGRLH